MAVLRGVAPRYPHCWQVRRNPRHVMVRRYVDENAPFGTVVGPHWRAMDRLRAPLVMLLVSIEVYSLTVVLLLAGTMVLFNSCGR